MQLQYIYIVFNPAIESYSEKVSDTFSFLSYIANYYIIINYIIAIYLYCIYIILYLYYNYNNITL